jgi:hypothetical protein
MNSRQREFETYLKQFTPKSPAPLPSSEDGATISTSAKQEKPVKLTKTRPSKKKRQ